MRSLPTAAGSYGRWILGTVLALVLGCGASSLLTAPLLRAVDEPWRWLALGAALGCFVGEAQTRMLPLDQPIRRRAAWIATSTAVGSVGSMTFRFLSPLIEQNIRNDQLFDTLTGVGIGSISGALCGLLFGTLHWLLRPWSRQATRTILANMLGWLLGWALLGGLIGWAMSQLD